MQFYFSGLILAVAVGGSKGFHEGRHKGGGSLLAYKGVHPKKSDKRHAEGGKTEAATGADAVLGASG